jgi:RNA polymerase subunit RPABC4/transcription elongation factor Spt4
MPDLSFENVMLILTVYGGMVLAAFWLAIVIWAYRDMRARSRDSLAQPLVALMVAVLTLPGLLIYILLRPRETLSEAYERSLEEEALLQEIEEKPTCPGCGQRVHEDWQVCPHCHTRLKKPCISCGRMLELPWNLCPHCATPQVNYNAEQSIGHVRPAAIPDKWIQRPAKRAPNPTPRNPASESLDFVEDEDY